MGGPLFFAAGGGAGSVGVVTDGIHDVRVTVLDLPLVSGVQGEEGRGALHCPTCMGAPPVTLPWFYVLCVCMLDVAGHVTVSRGDLQTKTKSNIKIKIKIIKLLVGTLAWPPS